MLRRERRFKIRNLDKERKKITNNKSFRRITNNEAFARLSAEDLKQLKDHTYKDKNLQAEYDFGVLMLSRLKEIDTELNRLNQRQ